MFLLFRFFLVFDLLFRAVTGLNMRYSCKYKRYTCKYNSCFCALQVLIFCLVFDFVFVLVFFVSGCDRTENALQLQV